MYALTLLAEATGGGQIQEIARTFGVDWQHLAAQIISFGIVCALLYRFAYHPVLTTLQQRRDRIAEGLANAEKMRVELAKTEAQRHDVMVQASAQASKFLDQARTAAANLQQQETQKALEAAEKIMADAREAARQDHQRMLMDLRREVGRLVAQTTAAVIGKVLTAEDQRRLAEQTAVAVASGTAPQEEPVGAGAASPEGYSGATGDEDH